MAVQMPLSPHWALILTLMLCSCFAPLCRLHLFFWRPGRRRCNVDHPPARREARRRNLRVPAPYNRLYGTDAHVSPTVFTYVWCGCRYWTDLDLTSDPSGAPGSIGDDSGVFVATAPGELTVTWLNVPYFCGVQPGAPTIACKTPRATASFQVTLKQDGSLKLQYQSVDPFASPPWAPVSIGVEGIDGYDGVQVCVCACVCHAVSSSNHFAVSLSSAVCVSSPVQVVYDDHSFPKAGTAIGFSSSCATAGENDCDVGDIARASASCLAFSVTRPDCMASYSFGQPPSAGINASH